MKLPDADAPAPLPAVRNRAAGIVIRLSSFLGHCSFHQSSFAPPPTGNQFLWNAKRLDPQLGWYVYHYRHYSPELGRWPSRDPIEEDGGVNVYGFVGNGPTNWIDLLGLDAVKKLCEEFVAKITGDGEVEAAKEDLMALCLCSPTFRKLIEILDREEPVCGEPYRVEIRDVDSPRGGAMEWIFDDKGDSEAIAWAGTGYFGDDKSKGSATIIPHEMFHVFQYVFQELPLEYMEEGTEQIQFDDDVRALKELTQHADDRERDRLLPRMNYQKEWEARRVERIIANEAFENANLYFHTHDHYSGVPVPHIQPRLGP